MNEKSSITNGGLPWKTNGGVFHIGGGSSNIEGDIPIITNDGDGWGGI